MIDFKQVTMGCGCSKPDAHSDSARPTNPAQHGAIAAPTGGPLMVPPPYRDARGRPIQHQSHELDRDQLIQALNHVGQYLDQHGVTANIVTVGGAVNTIYLQSRRSTHDVDFFLADPSSPQHQIIHEAARSAARSSQAPLGAEWLNNATQLLMGRDVQENLARAAFQQNTIVHQNHGQRGGVVVYAAPWSYAFCGKLNRLCEANPRPYDIQDAVVYLHEYLATTGHQTVRASEVHQWGREYRKKVTDDVLNQVDTLYYQTYSHHAIDMQS